MIYNTNPVKGRILALDLGKRRIGMALSDALGITAQGLPTLQRTTLRADAAAIETIAAEYDVSLILLGLPLHMDGKEGRQVQYTRDFADYLTGRTGRRIQFWDERMTSIEAGRVLRDSGISIAKRAKAVDRLSAQILLENYLSVGDSPVEY